MHVFLGKRPRSWVNAFGSAAVVSFIALQLTAADPVLTPLTYRGYLETPDGAPVNGVHNVGIRLMDAPQGGEERCGLRSNEVTLVGGRFALTLPQECFGVIEGSTELWLAVEVDGVELGRSKLGAVPYAIQANISDRARHAASCDHASLADSATESQSCVSAATADGASGALEQRLAALERRATTLESTTSRFIQQIDTLYLTAADDLGSFAETCLETKALQPCAVAAHRKCIASDYSTGWLVGEQGTLSNGSTFLAVACVKPYPIAQ